MKFIAKVLRFGVRKLVLFGSPVIRIWENSFFTYKEENTSEPVFIIGAPRTGSTILYQALTNAYQFAYIDNTACTWHRNLRFGLWLSKKKYGDNPHNNFKAEHGNTGKFGGHAPSECGEFWYRWLPKDRHFVDYHEVTGKAVKELRSEVLGASAFLQQPLLFKNLNAGQRLRLIRQVFPEAKIIFIRRDPRFVIRSILKGRKKLGIKEGKWWGIMPPNAKDLLVLSESEMCAAQVYYIERQIEEDLALFPDKNIREIHYQNLNSSMISDLAAWIGVQHKHCGGLPSFQKDDFDKLVIEERAELNSLLYKYPFKKELFL